MEVLIMHKFNIETSQTLDITVTENTTYHLDCPKLTSGHLILNVQGEGVLNLTLDLQEGSQWQVLVLHSTNATLNILETISLHKDAQLNIGFGEFTQGKVSKNTQINLVGSGSSAITYGAALLRGHLKWTLEANHLATHTYAELNSNVVIGNLGHCDLEVIGSIPKGNYQSKTHQMSKLLNLGEKAQASVYPKLLIDENDVEASHAASVGQPEQEHIYYLMSRGLSYQESMRLLIKGYLHPVVNLIEDETLQTTLLEMIDEEVQQYV